MSIIKQERVAVKLHFAALLYFRGEKDGKVICDLLDLPYLTLYEHAQTQLWEKNLKFWGMDRGCKNFKLTGVEFLAVATAKQEEKESKPDLSKQVNILTEQVNILTEQVKTLIEKD